MKNKITLGLVSGAALLALLPSIASAALTESQIQAVLGLLQSFGADQTVVGNVNSSLRGLPTTGSSASSGTPVFCPNFTYNLYLGLDDSETGGQVSELQKFLAQDSSVFPEGTITGFYGPLTEQAVKRWQTKQGIVSSGSPDTTGYGVVGSRTREKMRASCGSVTVQPIQVLPLPTPVPPTPTPIPPEYSKLPPVISGVSGPAVLNVGESGTWTVTAKDPENGPLSYSVVWGDESAYAGSMQAPSASEAVKQTATFTHIYSKSGVYAPVFYVTDSQGLSATVGLSVNVGGVVGVEPSIRIASDPQADSYGKVNLKIGDKLVITGYPANLSGQMLVDYQRAFYFDPIFNNACGNTEWVMTCTAKQAGVSKFYIEIYKNGKTYRSNIIEVTVAAATADQGSLYLSISGLFSLSVGQSTEIQAFYQPPMPVCPAGSDCLQVMPAAYPVQARWASSNPGEATVEYKASCGPTPTSACFLDDKTAVVRGISAGSADIKAVYSPSSGVTLSATVQVNVIAPPTTTVSEQVKCVFNGSASTQECYSSNGVGCKGTDSCTTDVKGNKGDQITWKSSCGGYAYTTIDGTSEYANFTCATTQPSITVLSPNGGETCSVGAVCKISWTYNAINPTDAYLAINLLKDNISIFNPLTAKLSDLNQSSYDWLIPSNINNTAITSGGNNYKMEVIIYNNTTGQTQTKDISDAPFSIVAANAMSVDLKVNGSDKPSSIPYGSAFTASWTSTGASYCTGYGTDIVTADGGVWTYGKYPASGSKTLYAKSATGVVAFSAFHLGIQCFDSTGKSVTDLIENIPVNVVVLQQSYPGFYMKTDKSSYTASENVVLTLSRADGKTDPYSVDLYAISKNTSQQILIHSNLQVGQNTLEKIQLSAWSIFTGGGTGDYTLAVCPAGCKYGSDSNINSTFFTIVLNQTANIFEAVNPLWWPSSF